MTLPYCVTQHNLDNFRADVPSPETETLRIEVAEILGEMISDLTRTQQAILGMRYTLDMTFDEIAKKLAVTENAVHAVHGRALCAMRRQLAFRAIRQRSDLAS